MKKALYSLLVAMTAMTAAAQETYESATISDQDLNGTARYVGMGGAMDALGADISTISSNPAGIGLFRKSQATISGGAQIVTGQPTGSGLPATKGTTASFDQIGFVIATRNNYDSYFNFAFNYHKSKNFNQILSAVGDLDGASQNKNSFIEGPDFYSRLSMLYNSAICGQYIEGKKNNGYYDITDYYNATHYDMLRGSEGYIGNFDFNISGNIDNRIYLGATVGVKSLRYNAYSSYVENMAVGGTIEVLDERRVRGTGIDVTFGAIFRPIETSPFRIGVTVASPTFYSLTTENTTAIYNNMPEEIGGVKTEYGYYSEAHDAGISYDFSLYTPWRFGLSAAHTIGNYLALGASIDYSDYGALDNRMNNEGHYSWYDESYIRSTESDRIMKAHTEQCLKGVATIKVGAEYKPADNFAVRAGYNYITPKYKSSGYKDLMLDSYGSDCASMTDYTNWKATNRLTFGVGFTEGNFSLDLAYQYSNVKGDFHPFLDSTVDVKNLKTVAPYMKDDIVKDPAGDYIPNYADAVEVSNTRHQILLTLGYRF